MNKIQTIFEDLYHYLITATSFKKLRLGDFLFYGFLAFAGIFLWGYFMDWGRNVLYFRDWISITFPRLTFLKNALMGFHLPLHSLGNFQMGEIFSNRFFAIPDSILSPQIALLWFLNVNRFCMVQIWLLYLLGFWGLIKLGRSLSLSPFAFSIFFILFNFNGHILAHITVGHLSFGSYFLFPWFVYLIFKWVTGERTWRWIAQMDLFLFFLVLNGGYHLFIYCLLFFGILAVIHPKDFWFLIKTILLAVGVNFFRLFPEVSIVNGAKTTFLGGFINMQTLFNSLIQKVSPADESNFGGLTQILGSHEYTFYIGIVGTLFLIYFGVIRHLLDKNQSKNLRALILPVFLLGLLSMDQIFLLLRTVVPLPFFTAERVPMRIFSLVLVFLMAFAAVQFQKWLDSPDRSAIAILFTMILFLYELQDLWENFRTWTIPYAASIYNNAVLDPSQWVVKNNLHDSLYILFIGIGLTGTLVCLGFICFKALQENKLNRSCHKEKPLLSE